MNTGTREKKYRCLVGSKARLRKSAEMNEIDISSLAGSIPLILIAQSMHSN